MKTTRRLALGHALFLCSTLWSLPRISSFAADAPTPKTSILVTTDRPDAIYARGDKVTFTIQVKLGDKPAPETTLRFTLDDEGPKTFRTGELAWKGTPVTVQGSMDKPGILRCMVSFTPAGGGTVRALSGAAISPLEIPPSLPVPDDFQSFWQKQKAALSAIPVRSTLTPVKSSTSGVEAYDVQVSSIGDVPVSGYFARPEGAKPGSLPIVLWVHGAGVRSSSLGNAVQGARDGFLSMDINAHGLPNGKPNAFYADLANGALKTYRHDGRENRDQVYFKGMFLRLVRALDFLTAQPEWNGKVVAVIGHSQGGAQALVAGGLDPRVTFIGSGVPAMCDHSGMVVQRVAGWPKIVPNSTDGKPDPAVLEATRYYDAVNFAHFFKGEAILSAGFIDTVCPATTCYAAYNQLQGTKQMISKPGMGHAAPTDVKDAFWAAARKHAGL